MDTIKLDFASIEVARQWYGDRKIVNKETTVAKTLLHIDRQKMEKVREQTKFNINSLIQY